MKYNIIAVDYYPLATFPDYASADWNSVRVGQYAGQVLGIDLLLNGLGQKPDQIHAIGFCFGGQLVGHFGRKIKENGGHGAIGRISCKHTNYFSLHYKFSGYHIVASSNIRY